MGIDWSEAYDNPESPNISPSVEESIPYGDLGVNASEASSLLQSPPVTPPAPHSLPNVPERHFTGNAYPKGRCIALARLISRYRGKRLDKGPQLSNWAAPLSKNQIEYAANDGCAGYDVYNSLVRLERADAGWKERQSEHYKNIVAAHNLAIAAQSLPTPDVDRNTSEGTKLTALPKKQPSLSSISASIVGVTIKRPSLVQDKDNVNADPTSYPSPPVTPIMVRTMTAILPSPNTSFQTEWGSVPSTGSRLQPAQSLPPAVSPQAFHEALWNLRRPQYMSQTSPAPPFHHPTQTPYYSPYPHTPDRGTAYQFSGAWTPEGPELGNQHGWISPVPFHGVYPMNGPSPSMEQHPPMWRRASGSLLDSPSVSSYHYHSSYSLQPSSVPKDGWVSNFNTISLKEPSRPRHRTHVSASVTSVTAPIGDLFKEHKDLSETKKAIRDAITSRHENE
ncbi:hypothetical protein FRC16_003540 [Serendipita sp. 398]|nr:hypothetical protein FRC16_003540 [Serendipita sp. 398]